MSARLSLSIALATYNGERFVGAQLDSIARQTRLPDELVIFDDASTDTTVSIVRDFAQHAPFPVRLQVNPERLGSTLNFEAAIHACGGEIIFLCDQDDIWYPDKIACIEEQFVRNPETGAVFTDADVVDQDLNPLRLRLWKEIRFSSQEQALIAARDATTALLKHPVATGATMAFRSAYRDLVLPIPNVWVHDAWISLLIGAVSHLTALPTPLIAYRQHSANQIGALRRKKNRNKSLAEIHGKKLLFYGLARTRLLEFADCFPDTGQQIRHLDEKLAFLRARVALPTARWRRLPHALREFAALRYYHYAMGLESFGSDLLHAEEVSPNKSILTKWEVGIQEVPAVLAEIDPTFDVGMLAERIAEPVVENPDAHKDTRDRALINPKLSICIGTYNRAKFIGETLDSMLVQLESGVEIVIVDNASSDNTSEVMVQYSSRHPEIHYFRKSENTGFDRNYDEAVKYAKGEYCWLMSDDDLICPGAIAKVLSVLGGEDDLIVVNSEARNADLSVVLESRLMKLDSDRVYREADHENFFARTAKYLSFVGCLVIRRTYWLSKSASSYYGTGFIHVGVIFQSPPIVNVRVMAEPSVIIRLGNSTWNSVRFEVWMLEWPKLIWSFPDFSDTAKRKISPREPWRRWGVLLKHRALGVYTRNEFSKVWPASSGGVARTAAYLLSIFPESAANFLVMLHLSLLGKNKARVLHDLLHSPHAGVLSRSLARVMGKKVNS